MVAYRSRVGSPGEVFLKVTDNMQDALDLGDAAHSPVLGVAVGLGMAALDVLTSEERQFQRLGPGNKLGIKRGRTFVLDSDINTSETVVFTGLGKRTERLVLDSDHGQRLVFDVDPGESVEVRFDPGERVTVHNNFRRP